MSLVDEFKSAVVAAGAGLGDRVELLPTALVRACAVVLPVAGAGLSVTHALRVPLASSDDTAATAERLQTTLGEGPCLTASGSKEPLEVDVAEMASSWPMFTAKLVELTPYRAVVSLPLLFPPHRRAGALDLYLTGSTPQLPRLNLLNDEIAQPIAELLFRSPPMTDRYGTSLPVWMDGKAASNRMNVWVAVGMLLSHAGVTSSDALATLRGYAFSHDATLDDIADKMLSQKLAPETVIRGSDTQAS